MKNPWEEIALNDYESHMKLDQVMQLQTMNRMMKEQFYQYRVSGSNENRGNFTEWKEISSAGL